MAELVQRFREACDAGADGRVVLYPLIALFMTCTAGLTLVALKAVYHLLFVADWSNLP